MVLRRPTVAIVWIVLGLIFAVSSDYLSDETVKELVSAVLAILLWPLLLLGIDLHVG